MEIIARRVDGCGRLWTAHRSTVVAGLEAPREGFSLHAFCPRVEALAATALREGRSVCAYDEPLGDGIEPTRLAAAIDAAFGRHLPWLWSTLPVTEAARIERDQDAIQWFLLSPCHLLIMGDVTFEKRERAATPVIRMRRSPPGMGRLGGMTH